MATKSSRYHYDSLLSKIGVKCMQSLDTYFAGKIFPVISVDKQADYYVKWSAGAFLKMGADDKRAVGAESKGVLEEAESTDTFYCHVHAKHHDVPIKLANQADKPLDPYRHAVDKIMSSLLIRRDYNFVQTFLTTTAGWTNKAGGADFTKFDDASSDPVKVIGEYSNTILEKSGKRPNVMAVSPDVHNYIKNHDDVRDRFKYTSKPVEVVTTDMLAGVFEVEKYIVMETTADTGTGTPGFLVSKKILLCYTPSKPGLWQPASGYIFTWKQYGFNVTFSRIPVPLRGVVRVEGELCYDMKLTCGDLGIYMYNVIT